MAVHRAGAKPGGRTLMLNLQAVLIRFSMSWLPGYSLPGIQERQSAYSYFRLWQLDGTGERIHRYLRQWVQLNQHRHSSPSVAIMDSQSVKIGT